ALMSLIFMLEPSLALQFGRAQGDGAVVPAKAQGGRHRDGQVRPARGERRVVQIALGVRLRKADRRGDDALLHGLGRSISSTAPAAPSMWPVMDLVEEM